MSVRNLWYMLTLVALTMLPLAGCSGSTSTAQTTGKGVQLTVGGKVDTSKASGKTVALAAGDANSITVYNAQDGAALGTAAVGTDGKFSGLTFTLPSAKTILVFKAIVPQGVFRSIVPLDLSVPPAVGITASNTISIAISQESTNIATTVSAMLGLTGLLGDTGVTLPTGKTYADVAQQVVDNGGQVLAYNTTGLELKGSIASEALLPAVDAGTLTVNDLNNIALGGKIISAFIPGKSPIVNFTVTNKATGKGIKGLRTFALHVAKLEPELNGTSAYWANYLSAGLPTSAMPALVARGTISPVIAATNPTTDASDLYDATGKFVAKGYTIIDHGDGTYTATFGSDITANTSVAYDSTKLHRIGISVRNVNVPGGYVGPKDNNGVVQAVFTSPNVANLIYDFTPSTGAMLSDATGKQAFARDLVTADACAGCHYKLALAVPNNYLSGHTGSRTDTKLCVMCHTSQIAGGEGEFVTFIHRIHMGEKLKEGGSFKLVTGTLPVIYNEQTYPQDIRNCTACHKGADVNNWKTKPNKKNCGSCHNATNFDTHKGGVNDAACAACHSGSSAIKEIAAAHAPVAKVTSTTNGTSSYYSNNSYLPTGAYKIEYAISAVTVDANRKVSVKFQIKKDGSAVNFGTYNASTNPNIIPNTVGGPSLRIAYNVTQDGITSPADTNAYMSMPGLGIGAPSVTTVATPPGVYTAASTANSIWANTAGVTSSGITWTLTGPDTSNNYTVTSSLPLPASTTIVTAFMYGTMTQTNVAGYPFAAASISDFTSYVNATGTNAGKTSYALTNTGLILTPANASKSLTSTGFTARRTIVDNAKCNACHDQLGVTPNFHGAGRNNGTLCYICHNPNGVNSGWSYNANTFIHGIHGASKRSVKYTFASDWSLVGYPGVLKNCEQCHVSGSYDFSATANAAAAGNLLFTTVATGTTVAATATTSPYIAQAAGTAYGAGFNYVTTTGAVVATDAAATTLVSSPVAAACFSCHDTKLARAHMEQNGGSIYAPRSSALLSTESCLTCHGTAANNLNAVVPSIKAVHRWW